MAGGGRRTRAPEVGPDPGPDVHRPPVSPGRVGLLGCGKGRTLVRRDLDPVPLQPRVQLEAGEAEQGGGAGLVAVRALEGVEDGLPLQVLQRARGAARRGGAGRGRGRRGRGARVEREVGGRDERPLRGDQAPLDGVLFRDRSLPTRLPRG